MRKWHDTGIFQVGRGDLEEKIIFSNFFEKTIANTVFVGVLSSQGENVPPLLYMYYDQYLRKM